MKANKKAALEAGGLIGIVSILLGAFIIFLVFNLTGALTLEVVEEIHGDQKLNATDHTLASNVSLEGMSALQNLSSWSTSLSDIVVIVIIISLLIVGFGAFMYFKA